MSLKIRITKGENKNMVGRIVGVYMNGDRDIKIGRKYFTVKKTQFEYLD